MRLVSGKITGDNLTADEWNDTASEKENIITQTGQILSAADLNQIGKGIADYVGNSNFYTDSGIANAYVLTSIGSKQSITDYTDGLSVEFLPANTNAGASTVNVAALGVKNIVSTGTGGEIVAGEYVKLKYRTGGDNNFIIDPSSNADVSITGDNIIAPHENLICKFITVSTVDIDAGAVLLKTVSGKKLRAESVDLTVDIEVTGLNGLDVGAQNSDEWYDIFVISDGTTIAGLFTISGDAPVLPTGFIYKALVGAVFNDATPDFRDFHQRGNLVNQVTFVALDNGNNNSFTSVLLDNAIPPTASCFSGDIHVLDNLGQDVSFFQMAAEIGGLIGQIALRNPISNGELITVPYSDMIIITPQETFYRVADTSERADIHVSGFRY